MGAFLRSFVTGFIGLAHVVRSERNMRLHIVAAVAVVAAGFAFRLAAWEWVAVVFCVGLVLSAECMNTALERLADQVSLDWHLLIKQAKDCASGAVLAMALTSAVVGGIVFLPKLWALTGW
ncbi:MAG: diacylglycerol kinase family protein [Gemmataceae bacterium]